MAARRASLVDNGMVASFPAMLSGPAVPVDGQSGRGFVAAAADACQARTGGGEACTWAFGLAAVEAMACGLPVAGFARGAAPEIVGEAGRLARPGDGIDLADAIGRALAIDRSVPRARVLRLFTRDLWLDRCEALYAQVASLRGPARSAGTG